MIQTDQSTDLKNVVVESILSKKGKEVKVLDLRDLTQSIADYFIICHGDSTTQVDAVADHVEQQARTEMHERALHVEGTDNSQWVLIDYGNIVVHVFLEQYRRYYNLEELWGDAKIEHIVEA